MTRNLICTRQRLVIGLIFAISLSSYGCSDTASVSEDVAVPLSSLTVTPGTLRPAFFSNTTNYAVNAPTSAPSVTVTAVPKDSTVTVTINGTITTQQSVTLGGPGSITTIIIALSSNSGGETTYTVKVTRLLSSDNNLSALTVTQGVLNPSPFDADTLNYTVDVGTNVSSVTVTATKSDPNAVMLIDSIQISPITVPGGTPSSGPVNIPLTGPGTNTVVSITVTAPNSSQKTYRITVKRAASSNNNLSALSVTSGSLAPPFTANTVTYTVNVATNVTSVVVSATKADLNAVMSIGSVTVPAGTESGQETFPLNGPGAPTAVSVSVTAQSGGAPKTYTITVNRAASSDDTLSTLTVRANNVVQPLDPSFSANILGYTANVADTVDQVTVAATKADLNAVMLIGSITVPAGTASGQETFPLNGPGNSTDVSVFVTAQSGGAPKTYTITVNRASNGGGGGGD